MIRKILNLVAIVILAVLLEQFLPWWSLMLASFAVSFLSDLKGSASFWMPFLAGALLWLVHSFVLANANDFVLTNKMAVLFPLQGSAALVLLVSSCIGGLAAGLSGVFGKECRLLLDKKK
tara:strand:+ start:2961 stop:3320 length:360 start_codon:yes stop_codon:yes gene_type:complete